jgi:tripeptide aminopeptidase
MTNGLSFLQKEIIHRFVEYVKIDTQSDPHATCFPSTEKQKDIARLLVKELHELGVSDAHMDEYGYVYATLPSNVKHDTPTICFCAHMDTAPDCSGTNVKPILHTQWDGSPIILPDDPTQQIRLEEHPDLKHQIGNDIFTASGTTLLGADNKAGITAIMAAVAYWQTHPRTPHGTIKIVFTPDEEVGRGTEKIDLEKLAADYAYTIDGESLGSIENETFSADGATIRIQGVSTHPGFAKNTLVNAIKIAAEILSLLPQDKYSPETTELKEGFIHPVAITGGQEEARIDFILRDFTNEGLLAYRQMLLQLCEIVQKKYPKAHIDIVFQEQYRNMKDVLDQHPLVVELAVQAIRDVGLSPKLQSIRGGTDGSRLSFMGLPCPNIFAGEHAFHSKLEWVSVQDMEKSAEVILQLARLWSNESTQK